MTSPSRRGRILHRADAAADGNRRNVWAVGPWGEREFAAAAAELAASCEWSTFADIESTIACLGTRRAPQALLMAQPRPGMHEQEQVNRFLATAPLTDVVVVAGTWCEGELRTGRPLAGVRRIYWHQLAGWLRRQEPGRPPSAAPHWAADARPAFGAESPFHETAALRDAVVAVDAVDYATFETLDEGLRPYVRACVWTSRGRGELGDASLGVWDGGQLNGDELAALARFCERFGGAAAAVVALVDFPRAEHLRLAAAAGAAGVMGKPYLVGEAVHWLGNAAALSRKRREAVGVTRGP